METLLRGSVDIDDDGIAWSQHIVLWGGNVHVGFKGQVLVVEEVVAENLVLVGLLCPEDFPKHGKRVRGQQVA